MTELERNFTGAMLDLYKQSVSLTKGAYKPRGLLDMLERNEAKAAAQNLIHRSSPSSGYTELYERRLLRLAVEALVLQPQWSPLFDREDLLAAHQRLAEYGFEFPIGFWTPDA